MIDTRCVRDDQLLVPQVLCARSAARFEVLCQFVLTSIAINTRSLQQGIQFHGCLVSEHLAHLGGFATGFLYLKVADWRLARAERRVRRAAEPSVLVHPGRAARASAAPKPRRPERPPAQAEIDRVLDKISARGIESLTPAERRFLAEMSRKMRDP